MGQPATDRTGAADGGTSPQAAQFGAPEADELGTIYRRFTWPSADGLTLAGRDYGAGGSDGSARLPLLCLPGLTRTCRDFAPLAARLTAAGHRLIVANLRGRGESERAPEPSHYNLGSETDDVLRLVDGLGFKAIDAIGTSRGGLILMILAMRRPGLTARVVLNDIGPRIGLGGLLRIARTIGIQLGELDWPAAIASLAMSQADMFPDLDERGWERYARRLWRDVGGRPAQDFDPAIGHELATLTQETRLPELWEAFAVLAERPVLLVRGVLSEVLTETTAAEMLRRHATVELAEVPGEGHAPLLEDEATLQRIAQFLDRA